MMMALTIVPANASSRAVGDDNVPRRVVILNATDQYLPAFIALDGAMRDAIRAGSEVPVEFFAESLDMHRFPLSEFNEKIAVLLEKKYQGVPVDVVVTLAPLALDFSQRHAAKIWPGAAIVFYSVPVTWLDTHSLDRGVTGIPVRIGYGETVDLALKLQPESQHLTIIAGIADPDRWHLAAMREAVQRFAGRLDVRYLVGLPLGEMLAAVRALPEDTIVLYLSMFRDGAGAPLVPQDVLKQIASVSSAPVFGVFETFVGAGIVAGAIAGFGEQGRRTGELVARIINGQDLSELGVQSPVTPVCIADWRQLRRWGIDRRLLPAGCEIRFQEFTVWDRYHWQFLLVLAVILAQTALILALVVKRRQYRQARTSLTDELSRRVQAESLAARLRGRLARFSKERSLGTMATAISHEINQPLIAIQNYSQAAKRRLQDEVVDRSKLTELFGKIEGQAERAGAITQRVRALVNRSDLQLLPVAPGDLIEEVILLMESEAANRGCRIDYERRVDLPPVLADYLEIQLVLVNLLQNALKAVGSADVYDKRISVEAETREEDKVMVSVGDRGPGVRPDRVADIFEPLYSGASGMGMGLAICRAIIEAHGGQIWYEPDPAGGAIFRFTLRIAGS